jgi:hypothetical protein
MPAQPARTPAIKTRHAREAQDDQEAQRSGREEFWIMRAP